MKIASFFAAVFACIGTVLLAGSMVFFLWNRNAEVRVAELPREAVSCAEAFVRSLNEGNPEEAARYIYGQPDLGVGETPANPESALLWEAFRDSIAVELDPEWAVEQSALVRTGRITFLDVSVILGKLPELTRTLMNQKIAEAEDLSEIYDDRNEFRESLVEQVLEEALQQAMTQEAQLRTADVTLKLVNRDGHWWVVPDQNLLQILSGLA